MGKAAVSTRSGKADQPGGDGTPRDTGDGSRGADDSSLARPNGGSVSRTPDRHDPKREARRTAMSNEGSVGSGASGSVGRGASRNRSGSLTQHTAMLVTAEGVGDDWPSDQDLGVVSMRAPTGTAQNQPFLTAVTASSFPN